MRTSDLYRTRSRFRPRHAAYCVYWLALLFLVLFLFRPL